MESKALNLEEIIQLAKENSLPSIRARHTFLLGYWRFNYFKSNYLPFVSINTSPVNFNRTITQRFDVIQNNDVYLQQRNIHSSANLSLYQRIGLTGGSIFLDSDIGRLQNFGNNPFTTYSLTPLRIGLNQPLFAFNEQKWEKKIEPLAFRLAKKRYLSDLELISLQALLYFFDLTKAQNDFNRADANLVIADTLLQIAKKRFDIGTITQDDIFELELSMLASTSARDQAQISLLRSKTLLNAFVGFPPEEEINLNLPSEILKLEIDPTFALNLALDNAPDVLKGEFDKLNADQEADRTDKENRFNAEINASIGLNQSSETLGMAFENLTDQEQIRISLNIPILDWGRRKGSFKMAQSQRELIYAEVNQARVAFEQELNLQIQSFPLKAQNIKNTQKGVELANKRYEITRQRYLSGNVDLLKLTSAIQAKNQAEIEYLQALEDYWTNYYEIQQLTLYDFLKNRKLDLEWEDLLK